jgi:MATE family multidrug resistance protein
MYLKMNKEILRLAVPNIISNVSVPLLSSVDTALMGQLSALHIGAVGLGSMIFNFLYWNFGFLRMGTTGLAAQAYGRQEDNGIIQTLMAALTIAMVLAGAIMLLQGPLGNGSMAILQAGEGQAALVADYFFIRVWAAPATLGLYVFMGWFFGMQNAIFPLILTVLANVLNIVVSIYLVDVMDMGVKGVAYGTLIAQYLGLLAAVLLFIYRYGHLAQMIRQGLRLDPAQFKHFLRINGDIFIRTLFLTSAFVFFYRQSSGMGELILAANTILLQYLNWMSFGVDGFAFAAESLVGKYKGAGLPEKTRQAIRLSFIWGMALAALYSLVYGIGGAFLLELFTNQQEVIHASMPFLFWMILLPVLGTPSYIWDGIYVGLTAAKAMRNSMLLAFAIFLIAQLGVRAWGNHGLWLALLLFLMARGGFQYLLYRRKGLKLN